MTTDGMIMIRETDYGNLLRMKQFIDQNTIRENVGIRINTEVW